MKIPRSTRKELVTAHADVMARLRVQQDENVLLSEGLDAVRAMVKLALHDEPRREQLLLLVDALIVELTVPF